MTRYGETQQEVADYLKLLTRRLAGVPKASFTTSAIADELSISRNLASQYLNELTRQGETCKVGNRPVFYFDKKSLERILCRKIELNVFQSLEELFGDADAAPRRDFQLAIGHEVSLRAAIDQCKAAIEYPSKGLPLLLVGEHGVGKRFLGKLAYEYGRNVGIFDGASNYVEVNCAQYRDDAAGFAHRCNELRVQASDSDGRLPEQIILFKSIETLSASSASALLELAELQQTARGMRFIFTAGTSNSSHVVREFMLRIPICATIPPYRERSLGEREALVIESLLRESEKLGVDIAIGRLAFKSLVDAQFKNNISDLCRCVVNACASALRGHRDAERLEIHLFQLPATLINAHTIEGGGTRYTYRHHVC